jgi:hypothetical protein
MIGYPTGNRSTTITIRSIRCEGSFHKYSRRYPHDHRHVVSLEYYRTILQNGNYVHAIRYRPSMFCWVVVDGRQQKVSEIAHTVLTT